jgi:hypothetical protein
MDCLKFVDWLENRDLYDVSEADVAVKHAESCKECQAKLHLDEQLDKFIYKALRKEDMPISLPGNVDLSLDRMSDNRSKMSYRWFGAFSAAVAVMVVFVITMSFSPSIPSIDDMGQYVIADHTHHGDNVLVVDKLENLRDLGNIEVSPQDIMGQLPQGYSFVGARICPLGDCNAVHMVFRHENKRVSVFLIKTADVDFSLSPGRRYSMEEGSHTVQFWENGKYVYAMIG